jgi:hypothetical protein
MVKAKTKQLAKETVWKAECGVAEEAAKKAEEEAKVRKDWLYLTLHGYGQSRIVWTLF